MGVALTGSRFTVDWRSLIQAHLSSKVFVRGFIHVVRRNEQMEFSGSYTCSPFDLIIFQHQNTRRGACRVTAWPSRRVRRVDLGRRWQSWTVQVPAFRPSDYRNRLIRLRAACEFTRQLFIRSLARPGQGHDHHAIVDPINLVRSFAMRRTKTPPPASTSRIISVMVAMFRFFNGGTALEPCRQPVIVPWQSSPPVRMVKGCRSSTIVRTDD